MLNLQENGNAAVHRRRYALCFFGLTRSLNWTIASIEERILAPLRLASGSSSSSSNYDIFLHTYRVDTLANERAQEEMQQYTHLNDFELLKPAR